MQTALHNAVEHSLDLESVFRDEPWTINSLNHEGAAPICLALDRGNTLALDFLIGNGADVNVRDADGDQPLFFAVWKGSIDDVRKLVGANCDLYARNNHSKTALHHCVLSLKGLSTEILQFLIMKSPKLVSAKDINGSTVLHNLAAVRGPQETMRAALCILLDAGSDLEAYNDQDLTPLHRTVVYDMVDNARVLVEAGASLHASSRCFGNILHMAAYFAGAELLNYLTSLEVEGVDTQSRKGGFGTPWDALRYSMDCDPDSLYGMRAPSQEEERAFVRLYIGVRNRNIQKDVDMLKTVLTSLQLKDGHEAKCRLEALLHQKEEWERWDEAGTCRAIIVQVREEMWEAAVDSVVERINVLEEEMESSPWEMRSCFDPPEETEENIESGEESALSSEDSSDWEDCDSADSASFRD